MASAAAALIGTALGAVTGAVGQLSSSEAQANAAKYNASLAFQNSRVATANATIASQAGSQQAAIESEKTRAQVGSIKTNEAGGGVNVNSGSAVDTQTSAQELGKLDALTIRSNATKEAFGYQTQATNFQAQGNLDKFEASSDLEAGYFNAAGTLLGGASQGASEWSKFQMAGAL